MEEKSRFAELFDSLTEWLNDQEWFQQIKAKWEELDPQSRMYLQLASVGGGVILVGFMLLSFMWGVHSTKQEMMDKAELLSMIQSANEEARTLRDMNSSVVAGGSTEAWPAYFENTAATAGIPKPSVTVSDSKPGATSDVAKESMYDITMKKINVRQAVRYAQTLENGPRPVKLRNLVIDTAPDGTGYLDATLSVSAFAMLPKQ